MQNGEKNYHSIRFIMKCALPFLLIHFTLTGMLLANTVKSQDIDQLRVNLSLQQASLKESLLTLQRKSGVQISFAEQVLADETKAVTLNEQQISVREALLRILDGTSLMYRLKMDYVIIDTRPRPQPQPVGTIKGRIVEFETAEPLPGATVRVLESNTGMSANEGGYYQFNLSPGAYTLEVSFIGYNTVTRKVQVVAGKESTYDIKLQGNNILGEVEIKARKGFSKVPVAFTSERQLLEEVRMSRSVISGISNEQINRTADRNAAEVVRRISGVSVVDDKFIVVRGMNQRYNLTYLNSNIAPSTELYSRAFAYDMLPSSIIDRIVVYKSPAAELLGDYAGGAIKVYTKNTSPVRALNIGVQINYREGTTFKDMNGYKGGSLDWLGFDDGTRKMPDIPGFRETGGRQTMDQEQMINSFSNTWQYGRLQALPDMQLFVNYFDNWNVFGKRLYSMSALTYTNEYRHFVEERTVGGGGGLFKTEEGTYAKELTPFTLNDQSTQITKLNLVQNFTLRLNDRHRLEFNNFLLNDARNNTTIAITHRDGFLTGDNELEINAFATKLNTFNYQQRFLYNGNFGGVHDFSAARRQSLRWNLGYSRSLQDVPDQRVASFGGNNIGYSDDDFRWTAFSAEGRPDIYFGLMSRLFIKNTENVYSFSADYSIQPRADVLLKAGTYQLYRTREMDRRFFKVLPGNFNGTEIDANLDFGSIDPFENYPALVRFREQDLAWLWDPRNFPEDGTGLKLFDVSSPLDRYIASEQNNSGYLQGEWTPMGGKLVINAGLRIEYNLQKIAGAGSMTVRNDDSEPYVGQMYYPVPVSLGKTDLLPSVNLNYRPDSVWVIRASYGRTVNRPEFRELSPFSDIDFISQERITGNPLLKSSTIENYDLRAELYPKGRPGETVSIGVFYKQINGPIERLRYATASEGSFITQINFINTDRARLYGLELELRKSLSFVPGNLFRNLSIVLNGAWIKSEVSRNDSGVSYNNSNSLGNRLGTFSGRPLQGQAPYVLNGGLFYENAGWGTKLGVIYNVTGPSIYAIADENGQEINEIMQKEGGITVEETVRLQTLPSLIEAPRHLLDLSFTQRLYKSLQMRINIQNLLDQPYRMAEDANWDYKWNKPGDYFYRPPGTRPSVEGDNDLIRYRPGRYYNVSFTYAF